MNQYALILAGGTGTRLWPISTKKRPKQFLNLYDSAIMINETIDRIKNIFSYDNIFIIINETQKQLAYKYIDYNIPRNNIIIEPIARNTAMSIFYSAIVIKENRGNGNITILSSDHYIKEKDKFEKNILTGINIANNKNKIVLLGIKPNYPATNFGYIKFKTIPNKEECDVLEFKEKPNLKYAKKYFKSKKYYWNSGIFIMKMDTLFCEYEKNSYLHYKYKELIQKNLTNYDAISEIYSEVPNTSIDTAILEKTANIKMLKGEVIWSDIGTINDFFKIRIHDEFNNVKIGNVYTSQTKNTNIYSDDENKLVVVIGNINLNVINSNNVILITEKEKINDVPKVIANLEKEEQYKKFL